MDILKEMAEKFIAWTKIKIRIHKKKQVPYFYEREIWWAHLGCNVGHEQDGKHKFFERPVIVLRKFNEHFLFAVPTSTKIKENKYHHLFHLEEDTYSALLSQMRPISSNRLIRKLGMIDKKDFELIKEKITSLIKNDSRINK